MFPQFIILTILNNLQDLPLHILSAPKAYLDPGSGSFVLQIIIATLLGSFFLIKGYWIKIKNFIFHPRNQDDKDKGEVDQP